MEAPEVPQTIQAIVIVLSCSPELEGKTVTLETLILWVIGNRKVKLEWRAPIGAM